METRPERLVLVVYEDSPSRDAAVRFCDQMVKSFWARCHFDVTWFAFADLEDSQKMHEAIEKASVAAIIVFSADPEGWLPKSVREWAASWQSKRSEREGAMIGLLDPSREGSGTTSKYTWLRNLSHRAGLDYLTQAPAELDTIPNSPETCKDRAARVTSVLNDILTHTPLPERGKLF